MQLVRRDTEILCKHVYAPTTQYDDKNIDGVRLRL
jgi:hypothetical protein